MRTSVGIGFRGILCNRAKSAHGISDIEAARFMSAPGLLSAVRAKVLNSTEDAVAMVLREGVIGLPLKTHT
jgi:hypothetical protein